MLLQTFSQGIQSQSQSSLLFQIIQQPTASIQVEYWLHFF